MKYINEKLYKIFKWNLKEFILNIVGIFIFCLGINLFIEPNHLYTGGILGLSQLFNRVINSFFDKEIYLTGIIYFLINVPLLLIAFKHISKSFCARTIFDVIIQTIILDLIPIPNKPIVNDLLTNVLLGGTIAGFGYAHVLSSTGSTGGTDIIGIILTSRHKGFSVGRFAIAFNTILYGISGFLYGLEIMVYSIMYNIIENISIDKLHDQNIATSATIFTKKKPTELLDFIKKDLDRGATSWEGTGEYDKTRTYITYVTLSRYELHKLEKWLEVKKQDVFMVKNDNVGVDGDFKKRLSK